MTLEAKRAAKLEKKLKILLGGYQVLADCIFWLKGNNCSCLVDNGHSRHCPGYVLLQFM